MTDIPMDPCSSRWRSRLVMQFLCIGLVVSAARPGQAAGSDFYEAVSGLLAPHSKELATIALPAPEVTGAPLGTHALAARLEKELASMGLQVIPPAQVLKNSGAGFSLDAPGLALVANQNAAQAALYLAFFVSPEEMHARFFLVGTDGRVRIDQVLVLQALPTELEPLLSTPTAPVGSGPVAGPSPEPSQPTPMAPDPAALEPIGENLQDRPDFNPVASHEDLVLVFESGLNPASPSRSHGPWRITQGNRSLSDLELVRLVPDSDIALDFENRLQQEQSRKRTGVILSLSGFVVAGLALPLFKQGSEEGLIAGASVGGAGVAVGVAGLVLWWIHGDRVAAANSRTGELHLLDLDQTRDLLRQANSRSQARSGALPAPSQGQTSTAPVLGWSLGPIEGGAAAQLQFRF